MQQLECSARAPSVERSRLDDEVLGAIMAQLRGPERRAVTAVDWRVLAYERVSKSVQLSIPDQKRAIEEDVARYGAKVERHRWDEGRSRWETAADYEALHADIESGQYTHLWLHNADRLGGDDQEFVATVRKGIRRGMVVRDTVHGEITEDMAMVLGLQSYWEIKNNHYRVILKLHGKHLDGVKLGAVPYGYKPQCKQHPCKCGLHGKHLPDPDRAKVVQELFERYAKGESLRSLTGWWNRQTGERRELQGVRRVLSDPYYIGVIVNCRWRNGKVEKRGKRKQEEWKVGTHEHPIVDLPTFATVQARLRSQENVGQHRQERPSQPLVGLVHCVSCDRRMRCQHHSGRIAQWECPLCHLSRSGRKLERALHGLLAELPLPEEAAISDYAADQRRMQQALKAEVASLDQECDKINRRVSGWDDALGDGTMSKERYRVKFAEAQQQLEELRQQRAALQDSHIGQPGRAVLLSEVRTALERMGNWTTTLSRMTPEELRGLYRALIRAINIDLAAGLMTVEYTEALARWCGKASDTVPLPSQKSKG